MLEIREIHKKYENQPLLRGVTFQVTKGETVCLLGPSGSGKSTLLRIIAGLETAEKGQVLWDGQDLSGVPPHLRRFGLMFQDYALFPHRNVTENIGFGLRMQGLPKKEIEIRVQKVLERVNLEEFRLRKVTELSGGEQQRVALARALAPDPRLLMLDEPLGALDRNLREQLGQELRNLLHETQIPAIYVTHDQEEAFSIADRLVVLHDGRVARDGAPEEIYNSPRSRWVAGFFDMGNVLEGEVIKAEPLVVQTSLGVFRPGCADKQPRPGDRISLLLRPAPVEISLDSEGEGRENILAGKVEDCVFTGKDFRITLRAAQPEPIYFYLPVQVGSGQRILVHLKSEMILCLRNDEV